ncbi:MAG: sulfatase [Gemmatimonadota bacterium]
MNRSRARSGHEIRGSTGAWCLPVGLTTKLGTALGLALGLAAGGLLVIKEALLGVSAIYNPHVLWMAPLAHALWALPASALLGAIHARYSRMVTVRVVTFLMLMVGLFVVLRVYGRELADWAAAVLSVGVAYRASGWSGFREPERLRRLLPPLLTVLSAAVAILAMGVLAYPKLSERLAIFGRAAPGQGQPNVLIVILDTVRAASMSLYGHERPTTPNIDAFATRGVTFDLAIAPSPWTLPSHASLFTGRLPHELSAAWRVPLDDTWPTLAEAMAADGYRTWAVVANLFNANSEMGLGRGFDRYVDYTASWSELIDATYPGRLLLNEIHHRWFADDFAFEDFAGRRTAREVTETLLRWIDRSDGRPFFAFANYFDAHDPYIAPDEELAFIAAEPLDRPPPVVRLAEGELLPESADRRAAVLTQLGRYEAALRHLDDEIGLLVGSLDDRGLMENTVIIVTSDHGEEFAEHGLNWHGHSVYLPSVHVPLIVVGPGIGPPGMRVPGAVTLRDVPATVAELTDPASNDQVAALPRPEFPGLSLSRFWLEPDHPGTGAVASLTLDVEGVERWPGSRQMESIVWAGRHYIVNESGPDELYDLRADPLELRNLASEDGGTVSTLREGLRAAGAPITRSQLPCGAQGC